ncbi:MAG: isovaleryl-CoA dehydrogenase [Acidobacteriota bacterium]
MKPAQTQPVDAATIDVGGTTHVVFNQPPPLVDDDPVAADPTLAETLARSAGAYAADVHAFGRQVASAEVRELGAQANENTPRLRSHDRFGRRLDEVEFHPAWHELMRLGISAGLASLPWRADARPGAQVARAAKHYLLAQIEAGVLCPLTMTFAAVPALARDPEIAAVWTPRLLSDRYDPRRLDPADKAGCTMGMAMTEKQGGSDVRANTTRAEPLDDGRYRLVGHKWFCSAPRSDGFLTLAQTAAGLTCFLAPKILPGGAPNAIHLQRLKDKLGNRSNASSEIEYRGAIAQRLGPEGRGVATILEMVTHTRLDCAVGSAGLMRQAVAQAIHHARHRSAFGRPLIEQPLMRRVLADLALESMAATALAFRLAELYDLGDGAGALRRIATAIGKYWITKRGPALVAEALECLGGNGYVEESILPRIYREIPLNSLWEGSGNVICLDVLRALARDPGAANAIREELEESRGLDPRLDEFAESLLRDLASTPDPADARRLVEDLALALQAAELLRYHPYPVADAFLDARLARGDGREYGTLPAHLDMTALIERATGSA